MLINTFDLNKGAYFASRQKEPRSSEVGQKVYSISKLGMETNIYHDSASRFGARFTALATILWNVDCHECPAIGQGKAKLYFCVGRF